MKVKKKKVGQNDYFYLEHSFRDGSEVRKKEIYLGTKIPNDLEDIKIKFSYQIMKDQYFDKFEKIKRKFSKELKSMPPSAKEKYLNYFMIKFTYDTNRIEGSTITLKETVKILDKGITPKNKPIEDVKEIEAHKKVFNEMINYKRDLSLQVILKWHKLLLERTHSDIAGKTRTHQVKVVGSKTKFPYPLEIEILLKEFIEWYHKHKNNLNPLELAALVHLRFVSIHPFTDGNGRISRLLMNFVLSRNGYLMLNIKYSNRDSYYNALEKAQVKKQEKIFVSHIFRRFLKEYKEYL